MGMYENVPGVIYPPIGAPIIPLASYVHETSIKRLIETAVAVLQAAMDGKYQIEADEGQSRIAGARTVLELYSPKCYPGGMVP